MFVTRYCLVSNAGQDNPEHCQQTPVVLYLLHHFSTSRCFPAKIVVAFLDSFHRPVFRPSATVSRDDLMESCTWRTLLPPPLRLSAMKLGSLMESCLHCRGGPPSLAVWPPPPPPPHPRHVMDGRDARPSRWRSVLVFFLFHDTNCETSIHSFPPLSPSKLLKRSIFWTILFVQRKKHAPCTGQAKINLFCTTLLLSGSLSRRWWWRQPGFAASANHKKECEMGSAQSESSSQRCFAWRGTQPHNARRERWHRQQKERTISASQTCRTVSGMIHALAFRSFFCRLFFCSWPFKMLCNI